MTSSRTDRFVKKLASLLVFATYRSVDVYGADEQVAEGPQLTVANHFGGFADPLLLVHATDRMPRIMARDKIWKIPIAGWIMNSIGAIQVHKPEEQKGDRTASRNDQMFASAYRALDDHEHVMIFPEGVTVDDPSIAKIKTGAARVALGARANGTKGVKITPAGIHYEDKAALRSRVSIQLGEPMDLDEGVEEYATSGEVVDADNRPAVRALTDDIERRLRRVAPDFRDWREAKALTNGAAILLRTLADNPDDAVSLAERDRLAGFLARQPDPVKDELVEQIDDYDGELRDLGVDDAKLLSGMNTGRLVRDLLGWLIVSIVLLPFAIAGVVINWLPYLAVKAVGLLRVSPAVLATLKPVTAILTFGIAWGLTIWSVGNGFGGQVAALIAIMLPLYLAAVIVVTERFVMFWRAFRTWRMQGAVRQYGETLRAKRAALVAAMVEAL